MMYIINNKFSMRCVFLISCLFIQTLSFSQTETRLLREGVDFFWSKKYSQALKSFEKESEKNPSYETKFWIASCHLEMREFVNAKKGFLDIVKSDCTGPEVRMSLVNLGICYGILNEIDSAFYFYDAGMMMFPRMSDSYFNKAQLLYSLGRLEEANILYSQVIDVDPTNWFPYMQRMEISFILLKFDDALKDLEQAKNLKPDLKTDFNMAYCFSMLGRYSEADSLYQKIYDENNSSFLNNYGFNKHKLGKSKEGTDLIMKSLKLEPDNSYAYRNLALMALDEGNTSSACKYLREAKRLNFFKDHGTEVNELLKKYCE